MARQTIQGVTIWEGRIVHTYARHYVLRQYHTILNGRRETATQTSFADAYEAFRNRKPTYQRDSAELVLEAGGVECTIGPAQPAPREKGSAR